MDKERSNSAIYATVLESPCYSPPPSSNLKMTQFDVGLVHRLADQMEGLASNIKKHVNTPNELART